MAPIGVPGTRFHPADSLRPALFNEGKHTRLFEKFGAHLTELDGKRGTYFAVWAPNAERISVVGDFNGWNPDSHPMNPRESSGVWEAFIPELGQGAVYKYHIRSRYHMYDGRQGRPIRFLQRGAAAHRVHRLGHLSTSGTMTSGCAPVTTATSSTRRFRFTKCISARGCACRKKAIAR